MGYYEERGVGMLYRPAGSVEGPHSLQFADLIIENLLAAEQGVKSVLAMPHQHTGNLAQDVAATIVVRELCEEYAQKLGYQDLKVYSQSHHPYGQFPLDQARIFAIVSMAPIIAALSGAESFMTFTVDEAWTTPTKEGNAASLRNVRMMYNLWKDQAEQFDMRNNAAVKEEADELRKETRAILDRVLELGDGDVAVGAIRAFETGELDVEATLMTTLFAKGKVLQVRDACGARRYLDTGDLPFTQEMKDFHKEKLAGRARKQGRDVDYENIIADWSALARGELVSGLDWREKQAALKRF
jgi:methylaspartate mutase epsilon subunit